MTTAYIDTPNNSTDDPEYLHVETRPDGGARLEIYSDGRSLGIDLDADGLERLRRTLEVAA